MGLGEAANQLCHICAVVYLSPREALGWKEFEVGECNPESAQDCSEAGNAARPCISLLHHFPSFLLCRKLPSLCFMLESWEEMLASHKGVLSVCVWFVKSQGPFILPLSTYKLK